MHPDWVAACRLCYDHSWVTQVRCLLVVLLWENSRFYCTAEQSANCFFKTNHVRWLMLICRDITRRLILLLPMFDGWLASFKLGIGLLLPNFWVRRACRWALQFVIMTFWKEIKTWMFKDVTYITFLIILLFHEDLPVATATEICFCGKHYSSPT